MVCLYCGAGTNIVNSRRIVKSNQTWRRHRCQKCHIAFTTLESCQLDLTLMVEGANSKKERFLRDKLFLSVYQALNWQNDKAINTANQLTQTIINTLLKTKPLKPLISVNEIYSITARVLKNYDAAAAVRYASLREPMPRTNDIKRFLRD